MTSFKRRILRLESGTEIKLYGNSMAIGASLEIGEGAPPNIFFSMEKSKDEKTVPEKEPGKSAAGSKAEVRNPHGLSSEDLMEIADYNMQLWMNFKARIRKYGMGDARVFDKEF